MASVPSAPVPLLVSLKAVDPAEYPYYGTAELEPAMPLQQALQGNSAIVADEFLIRLNSHVGETLRLGGKNFRITAVLKQEPDRISSGMGIGPRVMISQASLADTGLLGPGSRASRRLLVKLPDTPPRGLTADAETAAVRTQLEAALPDAQVIDFREGNPALTRGLDNATSILSLICLVAMVLGAIGVAMAMHAHLEQRMDMLAILKAVGAGFRGFAPHFPAANAGPRPRRRLAGRGRWSGRDGCAARSLRSIAPGSRDPAIPLAIGARRPGNRAPDHATLLFASAARCARGAAGAGFAQAGGTERSGHRRILCAMVEAAPATRNRSGCCRRARRYRLDAFRLA